MALEQTVRSGKAVGTRDRVVAWLAANGDVDDPAGMASTALAHNIGYPGSSIAFAQLLSGMERSGLIVRQVRGKRTYRVSLTEAGRERAVVGSAVTRRPAAGRRYPGMVPSSERRGVPARRGRALPEGDGVDYDELARRLLFQVARRLADGGGRATEPDGEQAPHREVGAMNALEQRLTALEAELSRARAARVALQEENEELRSQIERIRSNLHGGDGGVRRPVRKRVPPTAEQVDHRDLALLQQMLVDRDADGDRGHKKADSA